MAGMRAVPFSWCQRVAGGLALALLVACAAPPRQVAVAPTAQALAVAMNGHAVVLLGEVHDNAAQHRLRLAALQERFAQGWRPALAFEQFDADRQADLERARRERPHDADYLIDHAVADRRGWDWDYYRPFVQWALDEDLPIVAANLGRAQAMRVAREGYGAVFDAATQARLGLDHLDPALLAVQREDIEVGHCNTLPAKAIDPMVRAQIARDITLANALRPYVSRGVVLLTGNGHVRRDAGVPRWLSDLPAGTVTAIGLLEEDPDADPAALAAQFDAMTFTARAEREDPCATLKR